MPHFKEAPVQETAGSERMEDTESDYQPHRWTPTGLKGCPDGSTIRKGE